MLRECLEFLRSKRCLADRMNVGKFNVPGSGWRQFGILGGGDIFVIFPGGIHGEVETKAGKGGRLSVEQQRRQKRVTDHGGKYVVVHSVSELETWYGDEFGSTMGQCRNEDASEKDNDGGWLETE